MRITDFKKGDSIVRVEPAKSLGPMMGMMGETIERTGDRSCIGDRLEFLGIANGMAYFNRDKDCTMSMITGNTRLELELDLFSEGWEMFVSIDDIDSDNVSYVKKNLKEEVQKMIDNEDYETLNELKEMFNKITSK